MAREPESTDEVVINQLASGVSTNGATEESVIGAEAIHPNGESEVKMNNGHGVESRLLNRLQSSPTPLSATELLEWGRGEKPSISNFKIRSAVWHLVAEGQAEFTEDRKLKVPEHVRERSARTVS